MLPIKIAATLELDGTLTLDHLPFQAGQRVEVIVAAISAAVPEDDFPLRGSVLRYDDPFGPACPLEDWEALK